MIDIIIGKLLITIIYFILHAYILRLCDNRKTDNAQQNYLNNDSYLNK